MERRAPMDREKLLTDARDEVLQKHRMQIEEETAYKWAARAVATYQLYHGSRTEQWLRDAVDYYHEAVEHAALADHSGGVLQQVRDWIHRYVPRGAL